MPGLLFVALASAHPGAFRVATHDMQVIADGAELRIVYSLEVPQLDHQHSGSPAHDSHLPSAGELLSGFEVFADGASLPVELASQEQQHGDAADSVRIELHADLPPTTRKITVDNGNYPDLPGQFRVGWGMGPAWVVDAQAPHDALNTSWVSGESARSRSAGLYRRHPVESWLVPLPHRVVSAASTRRPGAVPAWTHRIAHPASTLLALLAAPLAGRTARLGPGTPRSARTSALVIAVALCTLLATLPTSPWTEALIVAGCLIAALQPHSALAGWAALVGVATMPALWPYAPVAAALGVLCARSHNAQPSGAAGRLAAVAVAIVWGSRLAIGWTS